jgi:serine/alanine adding enzyme
MKIKVKTLPDGNTEIWDRYVNDSDRATAYHLTGWSRIIEKTYGHKTYPLAAVKEGTKIKPNGEVPFEINGILPIVKMRNVLLSTSLISMPFCDFGGAIADHCEISQMLIGEAISLGSKIGAKQIELRNSDNLVNIKNLNVKKYDNDLFCSEESRRYRLLLNLPESSSKLMNGFKSKLRSQIRRPSKSGCKARYGKAELIDDFYTVFASNMRDLGSPVHSKRLFENIFKEFSDKTTIFVITRENVPLAGSITIGFRETMYNPWASSLRQYSKYSPNMLLYWKMLEFACDNGYKIFDFGRSYLNEGTYRFKQQWGAEPVPLPWQYISFTESGYAKNIASESRAFQAAGELWKKFPVGLTRIIGPYLRRYIGL